tara:strand:+ start:4505 stop:4981 length:477 start_codon:yes stop_codon:yes gene_type:complete
MDIDTTNIDELPVRNNIPVNNNNNEIVENMPITSNNITLDSKIQINEPSKKQVKFNEQVEELTTETPILKKPKNTNDNLGLTIEYKIIFLSTILFFIFMDKKFKIYIVNILAQIFGSYLKNDMGNISNIGIVFYSLFYATVLFGCVKLIDISSIKLSF